MTDIALNPISSVSSKVTITNKPSHLVVLSELSKGKLVAKNFIALDKPDTESSFIKVKGFYTDSDEESIINNYQEILTSTSKDLILEMMVPWHRVEKIRNLVFKAK